MNPDYRAGILDKMEQKQRLFIYDRKEMMVLVFLGLMVAAFAFTLGVHLGKRVGTKGGAPVMATADSNPVQTVPDKIPNRQEINEQTKGAQQAADESLNQALHDEVARTGIKLDRPRQVELPTGTKTDGAGATATVTPQNLHPGDPLKDIAAATRPTPEGKFTLQIGSYPSVQEAKDQVDAMEALGMKPFLRPADIKGKGRWYRIFMGGFASREEAERAGEGYKNQHVIETYIITKLQKD